jgi:uncharacterized cupredoxin-like copper-binding protein
MPNKLVSILGAALMLGATACSTKQTTAPSSAPTAEPPSAVAVSLVEFSVVPESPVGAAGPIRFSVRNQGKEVHEFVVVRSKLDPGKLPTKADGSVDEDKVDHLAEVEDLKPKKKETLKIDLAPGSYVLMCNRVETDKGKTEAHYKLGMRTRFTVR